MRAARKFSGIIGGKEKTFAAGDAITAKEADELGLADKPELVLVKKKSTDKE